MKNLGILKLKYMKVVMDKVYIYIFINKQLFNQNYKVIKILKI